MILEMERRKWFVASKFQNKKGQKHQCTGTDVVPMIVILILDDQGHGDPQPPDIVHVQGALLLLPELRPLGRVGVARPEVDLVGLVAAVLVALVAQDILLQHRHLYNLISSCKMHISSQQKRICRKK